MSLFCCFTFIFISTYTDYDVDGGRDLDIFDINEGMQKEGQNSLFFLMFPGYYSVTIVNQFSLCLVSIEAGLNLVEGDIVLDVVC